jgi:hypothetical protein
MMERYRLPPSPYKLVWGEMHGHTELSDGQGTLDAYFASARDVAGLDFCAITDHDHGGVGKPELWGEKWETTQQKVAEYHVPGKFITILGYERDSFPFYPNACVYYRSDRGEMIRGKQNGEFTAEELRAALSREDVIIIPHQLSQLEVGTQFSALPLDLMPPLAEVYSHWGASEYFGNPFPLHAYARGCFWRDALERGAKVGAIAGSDIHAPYPGLRKRHHQNYDEPGLAALFVAELSREGIFDALKKRRCYGTSGARISIQLRINGGHIGEEIKDAPGGERLIQCSVSAEDDLDSIVIVKNGRDEIVHQFNTEKPNKKTHEFLYIDCAAERETDYYYLRVRQKDGRTAWTSPIWVQK